MTNKIIGLILIFSTAFLFSQNTKLIYFDKKWKETSKENASFYRIQPSKKVGNLVLIEDFYINKIPQFQGYSLPDDEKSYFGDIVWYDENGFDLSVYQFYNNSAASVLTYYYPNGKVLRTIEYKNGKKDGEYFLYHQDGTILIKGKYSKGKPVEGDFEEVRNWEDYTSNNSEREANEEKEILAKTVPLVFEDQSVNKKRVTKKLIKSKIFWSNSKQLAQETWYDVEYDRIRRFNQVNYDLDGKVLQTIGQSDFEEYNGNILNGIVYEYYVQNQFAVAIKSKTTYKGGQKSGEEIKYYPNGKIQEFIKYSDGQKVGDEIGYNKDGNVIKKRTYKNGQPFDGNFNENFASGLIINQNYIKGVKQGETIVKDENGKVVAKGIYKDGRPFNGTFVVKNEEKQNELINVAGYKKNGVQKIFNDYLDDPLRTYTAVNDINNGETVFYDNNEVSGKLEYKNDMPYEGELIEAQKTTIYKKGAVSQEIYYRSEYDKKDVNNILKTIYTENGKRAKIVDYSFLITSHGQPFYIGVYKDGKPYSGYFGTDYMEFNRVDYYDNGVITFQYSNDYLKNLEKFQYPNYDIKSTYKNGKIVDDPEYIKSERQFMSKYWKNGILASYDIDLFAVHYFNRFHFELKDKVIEITIFNRKKKAEIVIGKEGDKNSSKLIFEGKKVLSASFIDLENTISPNEAGNILYYESNNEVFAKMISFKKDDSIDSEEERSQEFDIITNLFISNIDSNETIGANFNKIAEEFSTKKALETLLRNSETGLLANLWFNKEKKPDRGILLVKNKDGNYDLKSFIEGKVLEKSNNVDFGNLKKTIKDMNAVVEKRMNESFK